MGIPARLTTLSPSFGHGRVWTEVLDRLSRMTDLVVGTDETADVWLDNGHEPDPEIGGPVVACAYEVSWGTPELDAEFPPETLRKLSEPRRKPWRGPHVVTGAHTSKEQLIAYFGLAPNRVHVYPFGVDQELFHPRRAPEGRALVRERTGDDRPYLIFTAAISPRKNLQAVRGALLRVADAVFLTPSSSLLRTRPATSTWKSFVGRPSPRYLVTLVGSSGSSIPPTKSSPALSLERQPCANRADSRGSGSPRSRPWRAGFPSLCRTAPRSRRSLDGPVGGRAHGRRR